MEDDMKKIMSKKACKTICVVTVMAFLSNFCPQATIAGGIQKSSGRDQLSNFIIDVTGGCSAEEILDLIKATIPLSDTAEDKILLALHELLAMTLAGTGEIKPAQSSACASTVLLFMTGLTFVLFSGIISATAEQQVCKDQRCLGNYCVCIKKESTSYLEKANDILLKVGSAIIILGALGYVENCLLSPGGSVVDTIGIAQ
jgi:hypothetical protein